MGEWCLCIYCTEETKYTKPRQMDKEDRWCQRANGAVFTSLPPYYFSKTTDPDLRNGTSEGPRRLQPKCLSGCLTASEAPSLCTFGTSELVGLHLTSPTTSQSWQAWHVHPLHVVNGPVWKWEDKARSAWTFFFFFCLHHRLLHHF